MIKLYVKLILIAMLATATQIAEARMGFSGAIGRGPQKLDAYRLAVQSTWGTITEENKRKVNGYFEAGITQMHKDQNMGILSAAAVIRLATDTRVSFYFDIGLGLAAGSRTVFVGHDLGSTFLFEERIGVGALFGKRRQFEAGYRVFHYSNGYLAQQNQAMNLHLLLLGYWF